MGFDVTEEFADTVFHILQAVFVEIFQKGRYVLVVTAQECAKMGKFRMGGCTKNSPHKYVIEGTQGWYRAHVFTLPQAGEPGHDDARKEGI